MFTRLMSESDPNALDSQNHHVGGDMGSLVEEKIQP